MQIKKEKKRVKSWIVSHEKRKQACYAWHSHKTSSKICPWNWIAIHRSSFVHIVCNICAIFLPNCPPPLNRFNVRFCLGAGCWLCYIACTCVCIYTLHVRMYVPMYVCIWRAIAIWRQILDLSEQTTFIVPLFFLSHFLCICQDHDNSSKRRGTFFLSL